MEVQNWEENILYTNAAIRGLLERVRHIAVLGIKTEAQRYQPAYYVPQYLQAAGFEITPVPVYYPEVNSILGKPVYRRLQDVPGHIDLVDIFRRSEDVAGHVEDILAARPSAVWMQSGIHNDEVAETLARAGIQVVQDRCLMVEHRAIAGR